MGGLAVLYLHAPVKEDLGRAVFPALTSTGSSLSPVLTLPLQSGRFEQAGLPEWRGLVPPHQPAPGCSQGPSRIPFWLADHGWDQALNGWHRGLLAGLSLAPGAKQEVLGTDPRACPSWSMTSLGTSWPLKVWSPGRRTGLGAPVLAGNLSLPFPAMDSGSWGFSPPAGYPGGGRVGWPRTDRGLLGLREDLSYQRC